MVLQGHNLRSEVLQMNPYPIGTQRPPTRQPLADQGNRLRRRGLFRLVRVPIVLQPAAAAGVGLRPARRIQRRHCRHIWLQRIRRGTDHPSQHLWRLPNHLGLRSRRSSTTPRDTGMRSKATGSGWSCRDDRSGAGRISRRSNG